MSRLVFPNPVWGSSRTGLGNTSLDWSGLDLGWKSLQIWPYILLIAQHIVSGPYGKDQKDMAIDPAKIEDCHCLLLTCSSRCQLAAKFLGTGIVLYFIEDFATIASPLHPLIEKGNSFEWNDACAAAFSHLQAADLAYPNSQWPFIMVTGANSVGMQCGGESSWAQLSCHMHWSTRYAPRLKLLPSLPGWQPLPPADYTSFIWLFSLMGLEWQLAQKIEMLHSYDSMWHWTDWLHWNTNALSQQSFVAVELRRSHHQKNWIWMAATVEDGWMMLRPIFCRLSTHNSCNRRRKRTSPTEWNIHLSKTGVQRNSNSKLKPKYQD